MYNRNFIHSLVDFFLRALKKSKKQDKGLNFIRNASSTHTRVTELEVEQINFTGQ